jgi:hypothetical protein
MLDKIRQLLTIQNGRSDLAPDSPTLRTTNPAHTEPVIDFVALTNMAAGFTNSEDATIAVMAFHPDQSPFSLASLRALLGLQPSHDPSMTASQLATATDAQRIVLMQELIMHLRRYDFKTIDAISWQANLTPAEISIVAKLIPLSKRAQWCAGIVFRLSNEAESHTPSLARIWQVALSSLSDPEQIRFAHDLNWAITNRITLARSEGVDTLAPDHPLVEYPEIYLSIDRTHDFILSRAPNPEAQQYDAFTEQNFFYTATPDRLWDYVWFDAKNTSHPIAEVRRRAIEYLELSFLDSSAAGPIAALAGEYTSLALETEGEISREAKMLWDVVSSIKMAEPDTDPVFDLLARFIEAELVGNPHKNFTLNRFVRTAILIDPIATLARLPAWRALIKTNDPAHYQKFTEVEKQLHAMLYNDLPRHLKDRLPNGFTHTSRLHEWLDTFNDSEKREVGIHLIPYFVDKEQHLYGSVTVAALKLVTTLNCDLILPQLTSTLDKEISHVLEKAPPLPVGYPGYGELTAFKDLNYIRFMLSCCGRLGNSITSITLQRNRERYRQYTSFPGSHLEAQILRTASHIAQKRQPSYAMSFKPNEANVRRALSGPYLHHDSQIFRGKP